MTDSIDPAVEPETAGPVETPVETVAPAAEVVAEVTAPVAVAPVEDIAARVRKENADIAAVCSMQGKGDKAAGFIAEGKSLSDVVAALQAERASSPEIINRAGNHSPDKPVSWDKSVEKVNARIK